MPNNVQNDQEESIFFTRVFNRVSDIYTNQFYNNIHQAANSGSLVAVKSFLRKGVEINSTIILNETPLHIAVHSGKLEIIKYLIEQGADFNAINAFEETPLLIAVRSGNLEIVQYLHEHGERLNALDNNLYETLLRAAVCSDKLEIIQYLREQGANLNAVDDAGITLLHVAAYSGNLNIVEYLREQGAELLAANERGETAITIAFEQGHQDIVNFLQQYGAILPEHLQRQLDEVNNNQSTHTVSVHQGVSNSAKALYQHYFNNKSTVEINEIVNQSIHDLTTYVEALTPATQNHSDAIGAAQRYIQKLKGIEFTDTRSGVTLKEALALVWLGLQDNDERDRRRMEEQITAQQLLNPEFLNTQEAAEKALITQIIVKWLYEAGRAYNINSQGVDNNQLDNDTCISGAFNAAINALNGGLHSKVMIPLVNPESITAKARAEVETIFSELPEEQQVELVNAMSEGNSMPEAFISMIQDKLPRRLHDEFDSYQAPGCDVKAIINDFMTEIDYLPAPQRMLNKQAEIKQAQEAVEATVPPILTGNKRTRADSNFDSDSNDERQTSQSKRPRL